MRWPLFNLSHVRNRPPRSFVLLRDRHRYRDWQNPNLLCLAAVLAATSSSDEDKNKTKTDVDKVKSDDDTITSKVFKGFSKIYAPLSALASVSGLASTQKESEIRKPIMEEIDRIKE